MIEHKDTYFKLVVEAKRIVVKLFEAYNTGNAFYIWSEVVAEIQTSG